MYFTLCEVFIAWILETRTKKTQKKILFWSTLTLLKHCVFEKNGTQTLRQKLFHRRRNYRKLKTSNRKFVYQNLHFLHNTSSPDPLEEDSEKIFDQPITCKSKTKVFFDWRARIKSHLHTHNYLSSWKIRFARLSGRSHRNALEPLPGLTSPPSLSCLTRQFQRQ